LAILIIVSVVSHDVCWHSSNRNPCETTSATYKHTTSFLEEWSMKSIPPWRL